MKEIKYTKDGKKVVVIGDLNQTDKIVQEIFVTANGDEIPQGERFIEKNLLDEPAKSWKEKNLEELEARYEKEYKELEAKIRRMKMEKEVAYDALYERVRWLRGVAKEPQEQQFKDAINRIADFLSGSDIWVCVKNREWDLVKLNDDGYDEFLDNLSNSMSGWKRYDGMRLLSLFGKSSGDLEWRVSLCGDGTGGDDKAIFFRNKDEAISHLQSLLDKKEEYYITDIKNAEKFNLALDENKLGAYYKMRKSGILKNIDRLKNELNRQEEELKNIGK